MNGQTKKSPLEQFALNVSLTISSVYTGYTLEDLKDDLRTDYGIDAEEKAQELGFEFFKDFLESASMVRYVKCYKRNPNEERTYKAITNEKNKVIREQQREAESEKIKNQKRIRRSESRNYGAVPEQQQQNYINNGHHQRAFSGERAKQPSKNFHRSRSQQPPQPWQKQQKPQELPQRQSQQQPPSQKHWSQIPLKHEEKAEAPQPHPPNNKQQSPRFHQPQPQQQPLIHRAPPTTSKMPSSSFGRQAAPRRSSYHGGGASFGSSRAQNPSSHNQQPLVHLDGRISASNRLRQSLNSEGLGEHNDPDKFWDDEEEKEELKNLGHQKATKRNDGWANEEEKEAAKEHNSHSSGSGSRRRQGGGSFGGNKDKDSRISPRRPKSARGPNFRYLDIPTWNPKLAKQQSCPPPPPDAQNPDELGRSKRDEMPSKNANGIEGGRGTIRNTGDAESEGRREYWQEDEEEYEEVEVLTLTEPIVAPSKLSMAQKTAAATTKTVQGNPPFAGNSAKITGRSIWEEEDSEKTKTENEEKKAWKKTGANSGEREGHVKPREFCGRKAPKHQQCVNFDNGSARRFIHTGSEGTHLDKSHIFYRTSICSFWQAYREGKGPPCKHGEDKCFYAHGEGKLNELNPIYYKTQMCEKHNADKVCPYGATCNYAHDEKELRKVQRIFTNSKTDK